MDPEIDITADLVDGTDGSRGDAIPANAPGAIAQGSEGAQPKLPDGVVQAHEAPDASKPASSLRDQLSTAFKGPDEQAAEAAAKPAAQAGNVVPLTQDAEGKWRTADGTFASKDQITAFEAAKAAPAQDTPAQQQAPAFLSRMTPVEREQYNALPAETREFLGRTMEAVETQASRFGEYDLLEQQLIGPRRQAWQSQGITPAMAINQLFQLSDFAGRDPSAFVLWFADQHKIDLDAALDARDQALSTDPNVRALQGQVQQLQQQISQSQQGQANVQHQATVQEVETWATEKDEAGTLKRPYLTDVMDAWPQHVQALRAANPQMSNADVLQKAYENACWANPNVRTTMQNEVVQQQRAEAAKKAEAKRLAGSSVNGAPAGSGPNPQQQGTSLSIRDNLRAAFAEASA